MVFTHLAARRLAPVTRIGPLFFACAWVAYRWVDSAWRPAGASKRWDIAVRRRPKMSRFANDWQRETPIATMRAYGAATDYSPP